MRKMAMHDRSEGLSFALTKSEAGPKELYIESMLNQENLPGDDPANPHTAKGKGFQYQQDVNNGRGIHSLARPVTVRSPTIGSRP